MIQCTYTLKLVHSNRPIIFKLDWGLHQEAVIGGLCQLSLYMVKWWAHRQQWVVYCAVVLWVATQRDPKDQKPKKQGHFESYWVILGHSGPWFWAIPIKDMLILQSFYDLLFRWWRQLKFTQLPRLKVHNNCNVTPKMTGAVTQFVEFHRIVYCGCCSIYLFCSLSNNKSIIMSRVHHLPGCAGIVWWYCCYSGHCSPAQ